MTRYLACPVLNARHQTAHGLLSGRDYYLAAACSSVVVVAVGAGLLALLPLPLGGGEVCVLDCLLDDLHHGVTDLFELDFGVLANGEANRICRRTRPVHECSCLVGMQTHHAVASCLVGDALELHNEQAFAGDGVFEVRILDAWHVTTYEQRSPDRVVDRTLLFIRLGLIITR